MTSRHGQATHVSASMVVRIQAHDANALRELIQQTSPSLLQYATSLLGSRDDAEDIVQEVFTAVWDLGARWQPVGDPIAYLLASVRTRALNELRRRSREERRIQRAYPVQESMLSPMPDSDRTVLNQLVDAEEAARRVQRITSILDSLPERQRTAYELRYRRGLSMAIVAEVLGISVKGAESLIGRATQTIFKRFSIDLSDP